MALIRNVHVTGKKTCGSGIHTQGKLFFPDNRIRDFACNKGPNTLYIYFKRFSILYMVYKPHLVPVYME